MNRANPDAEYVKEYSIALLCLGFFLLLGALQFRFALRGAGGDSSLTFISNILCLQGFSCLAVSLLRWLRVSAALPATVALSLCLLLVFPLGTAIFVYWFTRVRPREAIPQHTSQRTWFNYTVTLYILGLLMLDAALVFRFALGSNGPEDQLLEFIELGIFVVALAAIVIGALRSTQLLWAHWATFILNVLLVLWFPLGTVLALFWFFGVRKHERKLLYEEWRQSAA
jgi:NADH:ubiquinone oxidoreductase subunit 3 (subunit A)